MFSLLHSLRSVRTIAYSAMCSPHLIQLCRRRCRIYFCDIITRYVAALLLGPTCDERRLSASGLLWLSELIEEHSRLAKTIGERSIYVSALRLNQCCIHLTYGVLDHHCAPLLPVLDGLITL